MKVTVDVKNAQATEETRGSDMVAEGMMDVHKDAQPIQTCSGGFIKTQLHAIRCCFFAIGEHNLI